MAFSNLLWAFVAVFAVGAHSVFGDCGTDVQNCASGLDSGVNCKKLHDAYNCLDGLEDSCGSMVSSMLTPMKSQIDQLCGGGGSTGGGSGGSGGSSNVDCSNSAYNNCVKGATKDTMCKSYNCVNQLKGKCDGKGFEDFYKSMKALYDEAKQKCGCGNLQPSLFALIASAIFLALRSRW